MNDTTYLAAMAHIGWACLVILATALLSSLSSHRACIYASAVVTGFAFLKEYVYDAHFELPKQTFRDNTQDFCGYLGGIALAWCILTLRVGIELLSQFVKGL
jgi:hypothetical protein